MNDGRPPDRWVFILDIGHDGPPPAVVAKRVLKNLLRRWKIRCRRFSQDQQVFDLMAENEQLRKAIDELKAGAPPTSTPADTLAVARSPAETTRKPSETENAAAFV